MKIREELRQRDRFGAIILLAHQGNVPSCHVGDVDRAEILSIIHNGRTEYDTKNTTRIQFDTVDIISVPARHGRNVVRGLKPQHALPARARHGFRPGTIRPVCGPILPLNLNSFFN
jgi:hypothetical protein